MRVSQIGDDRAYEFRIARVGNVIDLVGVVGPPKYIDLTLICIGKLAAVTRPDHLRAAGLADSRAAREMFEIARARWVRDIDDRGTVRLHVAGHGIERSPAMMTDVGDPAVALLVNDWLRASPPSPSSLSSWNNTVERDSL